MKPWQIGVAFVASVSAAAFVALMLDEEPVTPSIDAAAVEICINYKHLIRQPDAVCEAGDEGHKWTFFLNRRNDIPAVGDAVAVGEYTFKRPEGHIPRAPAGGATFKRN